MTRMLELNLADGKELDIPAGSVVMIEEMNKSSNPNFPKARAFIRYQINDNVRTAILSTSYADVIRLADVNVVPGWLRLTLSDESKLGLAVLASNVVSRRSTDDGCAIDVLVGSGSITFEVSQSRSQIKKWSEVATGPDQIIPIENDA